MCHILQTKSIPSFSVTWTDLFLRRYWLSGNSVSSNCFLHGDAGGSPTADCKEFFTTPAGLEHLQPSEPEPSRVSRCSPPQIGFTQQRGIKIVLLLSGDESSSNKTVLFFFSFWLTARPPVAAPAPPTHLHRRRRYYMPPLPPARQHQ